MARSRLYFLTASAVAATAAASSASAQSAESATSRGPATAIEEVVVTARRTTENLQTTPVAVTATTGEMLERAQINTVDQLQNIAPGLVVQPGVAQPGSATFTLRGQSAADTLMTVDPAVGVYADGVYIARSTGGQINFVDMERVEVLRGPQGTLFGRNTTGGAINLVTRKPSSEFEGSVRLRYGNFDAKEFVGVLNVPVLGDQLAFRGAYQHTEHGGFGRNVAFNEAAGTDNTDFIRASVLIAPSGRSWQVLVQGDFTDRRTGPEIIGLKSYTALPFAGALINMCSGPTANTACPYVGPVGDSLARYAVDVIGKDDFYRVYNSIPGLFGRAEAGGVSATIDVALNDALSLKSISAWRAVKNASLSDNDGTPYLFSGGLTPTDGNRVSQDQVSQELQLSGKFMADRLSTIAGLFYFEEDGTDGGANYALYPLSAVLSIVDSTVVNKSYAGYGQLTYQVTDTLRFTGGLRYTKDTRSIVRRNRNEIPGRSGNFVCAMAAATLDPGTRCQATNARSFGYTSYTASLDWRAREGVFLYIKTSRANRAGGFNTRAVTGGPVISYEPEQVTDYELGSKIDLFERRLRLNIAAFLSDYNNVQRSVPVIVPGSNTLTSGIQNAAVARIKGLEAELTVLPARGLQLRASGTVLDPKYKRFTIPTTTNPALDVSATPFVYTPKFSYTLSADYTLPVGIGDANFHLEYAHRSASYVQGPLVGVGLFGATKPDTARMPPYGILNGQVALQLRDGKIELALYGRNLTKTKYYQRLLGVEDALGVTSYLPGDPRTYGISATLRF